MYIKKIIATKLALDISKYYSLRCPPPDNYVLRKINCRSKNINATTDKQKEINEHLAKEKLELLIMNNFNKNHAFITLTYAVKPSAKESKNNIKQFLKRLRRYCNKIKIKLKYIIITEYGVKGRLHHHMICNVPAWTDIEELNRVWGQGDVDYRKYKGRPIDAERIANYFIIKKMSAYYTDNKLFQKRYYPSQNLEQPEIKRKKISAKTWRISVPTGYSLDTDSVRQGVNCLGYPYLRYRLIKINPDYGGKKER